MGLLDSADWSGNILKDGTWQAGGGGDYSVIEPATGNELGRMGLADTGDVREASAAAVVAQRRWAAMPHPARAAVLRRAGDLWQEHASEYGLSLGIVTRDAMRGLAVAEQIPTGIAHINDQTVSDEANAPFGGVRASGNGSRFGGAEVNIEAFTETRWITMRGAPAQYPF